MWDRALQNSELRSLFVRFLVVEMTPDQLFRVWEFEMETVLLIWEHFSELTTWLFTFQQIVLGLLNF